MAVVREILGRLHSQGGNPEVLLAESVGKVSPTQPCGSLTTAAMSDASKRRGDESEGFVSTRVKMSPSRGTDDYSEASFQLVLSEEDDPQLPVLPEKSELPAGILSFQEWGDTVCELPAVKSLKKTYKELVAEKSHHDYLLWVLKNGKNKGARCADLRSYLIMGKFASDVPAEICYPGSTEVRKTRASKTKQ